MEDVLSKARNLSFLADFLKRMDLSVPEVADLMGTSRQRLYHWFRKDDARVSVLCALAESCGCRLSFDLVRKRTDTNPNVVRRKTTGQRIDFVWEALQDSQMTIQALADSLQISASAVKHWKKVDDCMYSTLLKIADTTGLELKTSFKYSRRGRPVKNLFEYE